jgi:hypothetical protein
VIHWISKYAARRDVSELPELTELSVYPAAVGPKSGAGLERLKEAISELTVYPQ